MKKIGKYIVGIMLVSLIFGLKGFAQNNEKFEILDKFIAMHNSGSEAAITKFIKETYHPSIYKKIKLEKHIAFYDHIINEFGPLNETIYDTAEKTESKLIVHLIKSHDNIGDKNIDPTEILVVEIDLHEKDTKYMSRGLGLGALACARE